MPRRLRAVNLDALPPGALLRVDLEGTPVALARIGESVYAIGGTCPHRGGSLGHGRLSGSRLACPLHGWMFDVRSGRCLFPPRGTDVRAFPVTIEEGAVYVELPDDAAVHTPPQP
jgi:nitrite reductase/ring-hydroxylating ferredoxin subunit